MMLKKGMAHQTMKLTDRSKTLKSKKNVTIKKCLD